MFQTNMTTKREVDSIDYNLFYEIAFIISHYFTLDCSWPSGVVPAFC